MPTINICCSSELDVQELPGRAAADPLSNVDQEEMSVRIVTLPSGLPRNAHYHPHSAEFYYVLKGRGVVWWNGTLHPVKEGDSVFLPKGYPHATVPDPGEEMNLLCFFPHPNLRENLVELKEERVDEQVHASRNASSQWSD